LRVIIAAAAERDLDGIADYIATDNPAAAEAVFRRIIAAADLLRSNPELGKPGHYPGTRELVVARVPYVIIYTRGDGVLRIVAILHTARDLPRAIRARMKGGGVVP
jgi:addiction module RelE/StbE family toxin